MLWRSVRLSAWVTIRQPPAARFDTCRPCLVRQASDIASRPSIARILATPPAEKDESITVVGLVRTVRSQKRTAFVELEDGSTPESLQAILKPAQADGLGTGASVALSGKWQRAPQGAEQSYELKVEGVTILGKSIETYPIQKKYHSPEYLRTIPHLRLRTPLNAVLARMRSEVDYHLTRFFRSQQFVRLQPPVITSSDCEGAGEVFNVSSSLNFQENSHENTAKDEGHFFKSPKYLTVSSQLHLEAFVHEHPKVWTLSPTFRAEKSDTSRHVSEFWMVEAEMQTDALADVLDLVENMIRALVIGLKESSFLQDLGFAQRKLDHGYESKGTTDLPSRWESLLQSSWRRITYEEAVTRLKKAPESHGASFQREPSWDGGLQLEHERWIAAQIGRGSPVFVTHYPQSIKPFYMLPSQHFKPSTNQHSATVECFDLLLPETCEIVGGSLREHRLDSLLRAMKERGMKIPGAISTDSVSDDSRAANPAGRHHLPSESTPSSEPGNLDWYIDLRRYGSIPHGGFGLGLDRLLGYLAGVNNIKDVVPWPRYYGRCDC